MDNGWMTDSGPVSATIACLALNPFHVKTADKRAVM